MNAQPSDCGSTRKPSGPRCIFCGGNKDVELHHVGGRNHVAWFTMPLCRKHHARVTAALRFAGVEMLYTPERGERLRRARKAALTFLWILEELEEFGKEK